MKRIAFTLIKDIQNENEAEAAIMPLVEAIRATGLEPRQDRFLGSFRVVGFPDGTLQARLGLEVEKGNLTYDEIYRRVNSVQPCVFKKLA